MDEPLPAVAVADALFVLNNDILDSAFCFRILWFSRLTEVLLQDSDRDRLVPLLPPVSAGVVMDRLSRSFRTDDRRDSRWDLTSPREESSLEALDSSSDKICSAEDLTHGLERLLGAICSRSLSEEHESTEELRESMRSPPDEAEVSSSLDFKLILR